MNGLKEINGRDGHEAGDALIQTAAGLIAEVFADCSYRIGGDEFAVFLVGVNEEAFNEKTAALQDKMWAHGVHISVGALWQARCDDPEELFRGADARMYEAKQAYYRRLAQVEG